VATPYGVLDGVAMFNWTGAAWAAVQGPTLDIVFSGPTLDPRLTFGRGSTATYFDSSGVMRTVSGDTPRFDYDPVTHALNGLLIEESRTNSLLNTATLNTQSVAVTAQAYTLSFYGTGTVTKSGTASGALVGAGAFPQRVSQTFTPTAGTLTLTVTGSALNAQLEAGTFPTSYIPTAGAAVTRALEVCYIPVGTWFSPTALSLMFEVRGVQEAVGAIGGFSDGVFGNSMYAILNGTQLGTAYNLTGGTTVNGAVAVVGANLNKTCCSFTTTRLAVCNNSGAVAVGVLTTTPMPATVRLSLGNDPWSISTAISGYMRRVRYWPRALSDTELQSVTT
jgi:hypothetical protein